jgi:aryl carrier-like protein
VADIWCQVLGLTKIGTRTTFMASGGDSILLMALMARLKEDLHAEIPLIDVLRNPTVAGMADLVRPSGPNY